MRVYICWLGWHKWYAFPWVTEFGRFHENGQVCLRCGLVEMADARFPDAELLRKLTKNTPLKHKRFK
jgi:hypothetical protein